MSRRVVAIGGRTVSSDSTVPALFTDNFRNRKLSVISESGDFYTTEEAASLLGITSRRVRQMLDDGTLVRVARGLVDATSVERHRAIGQGARTRAWAEYTAWGAVALLSGMYAAWLGPTQASRVRATLRDITTPADLVARVRDRAVVHTYSGHRSAVARMRHDLVTTDAARLGLARTSADRADGYAAAATLSSTVRFLGLREDPTGVITVRSTTFDINIVADLATSSTVLAALDAATSLDPRERGVGERELADSLARYSR